MDARQAAALLSNLVEAMAVNAEIESMKAENSSRQYRGEVQAYTEEVFKEKADNLWAISNNILVAMK